MQLTELISRIGYLRSKRRYAGERTLPWWVAVTRGQAIVYLAPQVKTLHLVVRRPLEETMSQYLIDRIKALDNVQIHVGAEIVALRSDGNGKLVSATVRDTATDMMSDVVVRHLFLFIGADPNIEWL